MSSKRSRDRFDRINSFRGIGRRLETRKGSQAEWNPGGTFLPRSRRGPYPPRTRKRVEKNRLLVQYARNKLLARCVQRRVGFPGVTARAERSLLATIGLRSPPGFEFFLLSRERNEREESATIIGIEAVSGPRKRAESRSRFYRSAR